MAHYLAKAVFVVAQALQAPAAPPDKAETAAAERAVFLGKLSSGLASGAEEYTCTGPWAEDQQCSRRWPGPPDELASFDLMIGFFESKNDARIQKGGCNAWGRTQDKIECDGEWVPEGGAVRPARLADNVLRNRYGQFVFRARSVFQVRVEGVDDDVWRNMLGDGETNLLESARASMRILCGSRATCRSGDWASCTVRNYASASASWPQTGMRVKMFQSILTKVRAAMASN